MFVTDSGLAANLLRVTSDSLRAPGHPALGGLVETFVLSELMKLQCASEPGFTVYHLRDLEGAEVDFLLQGPDGIPCPSQHSGSTAPCHEAESVRYEPAAHGITSPGRHTRESSRLAANPVVLPLLDAS